MRAIGRFFASLFAGIAMLLGIGCTPDNPPECVYGPPEYFDAESPDDAR